MIPPNENPKAISVPVYLNALKEALREQKINYFTFIGVVSLYTTHNEKYHEENAEIPVSIKEFIGQRCLSVYGDLFAHRINPYITLSALKKLLQATASSPKCHEIVLSDNLNDLEIIQNFSKANSYKFANHESAEKNT